MNKKLRIHINKDGVAHFFYSTDRRHYLPFGHSYQLIAGNFRGAHIGLYTFNTEAEQGVADFDYLHYTVKNK